MAIALRYAARSDIGLGRYKNNQDSGYAGPHLLVVADGMGGAPGGDVASSIAVGELAALDGESLGADAMRRLEGTIRAAQRTIVRRVGSEPALAGMATTVTALLRSGDRLALAHIGDSRAYVLHDGELTQVTHDHSFVQRLVDEGRITEDEAERHPQRSVIMRVLGDTASDDDIDSSVRQAQVGDRWLLCSDGLTRVVSHDTLRDALAGIEDPGACADQLIRLALRGGGPDNVTCVVADVVQDSSVPPSVPQVVGSAALDRTRPTVATGSAARAAALSRSDADDAGAESPDDEEPERRGPLRRFLAALLVLAVLAAGGYAAWAWSQQQYFVGAAAGDVAIYQGLSQDIGPLALSSVHERQDLPLDTLPDVHQDRVRAGITAEDLADARRVVTNLWSSSRLCREPAPTATAPTPDPAAPTPDPAAPTTDPAAPSPTPVPAPTPTPTPTPTIALPAECEG